MRKEEKGNLFFLKSNVNNSKFAGQGINYAIKSQPSLWLHLATAIFVTILGHIFRITTTEWLLIIIAFGLVLSAEMFNVSVEKKLSLVHFDQRNFTEQVKNLTVGLILILVIKLAEISLRIFRRKNIY